MKVCIDKLHLLLRFSQTIGPTDRRIWQGYGLKTKARTTSNFVCDETQEYKTKAKDNITDYTAMGFRRIFFQAWAMRGSEGRKSPSRVRGQLPVGSGGEAPEADDIFSK